MAYAPHDSDALEHELIRLNAFGTIANRFMQEPMKDWDESFTECLFTLVKEMSDSSASAWKAFLGPDAPKAL